jgi:SAM-dependent methyltransferase
MIDQIDIGDFREISRDLRKNVLPFKYQYQYSLFRHFGTPENIRQSTFLDLGSGVGNQLQNFVASYGAHIINIDLDPRVIDELKSTGAEARQGSIYDIPFKTGKADGVLCSEVIDIVPKSANELKRLFVEVHRVLKSGGIFLQRHRGAGSPHNFPDAKGQLDILAHTGFRDIKLHELPGSRAELNFSAVSTPEPQTIDRVLKSNYKWAYRNAGEWHNGYGTPRNGILYGLEKEGIKLLDIETIKKNLADALVNNKPFMLLNAIRSTLIHFWPEDQNKYSLIETAADFDFQFVQIYPQFIDEDYCLQNDLDPTVARDLYREYGLNTIIDEWKQGKPSQFRFFGGSPHEKLIFDPDKKIVSYLGNSQDSEEAALQTRFYSVFGSNGLEIT